MRRKYLVPITTRGFSYGSEAPAIARSVLVEVPSDEDSQHITSLFRIANLAFRFKMKLDGGVATSVDGIIRPIASETPDTPPHHHEERGTAWVLSEGTAV